MQIPVQKLNEHAKLPTYAHQDDAGMDFYALAEMTVPAGARADIPTGIAMAIPEGYAGLIWDKSGLAAKHGITILGGVFDAGYRGEVRLLVLNTGTESYTFAAGDKVAQMLIQKVAHPTLVEVDEFDDNTERGEGKFGSTGTA